jgi:hypothetical protein
MSRWSARRWLAAFRATGGIAWLHNGRLGVAWYIAGWTDDQHAEARRLYRQIEEDPLRYDAATLQVAWSG